VALLLLHHSISAARAACRRHVIFLHRAVKPEAAYFTTKDGKRGGFLIFNVAQAAEIPRLAEPWFLSFEASVECMPALVPEDLQKAGLEELAKKWGSG
jgi:hypothetical protein